MRLTLVHSMRFAAVGAPGSIVTHALVVIQAGTVYSKLSGPVGQRGCDVQADVQTSRFQLLGRMKIAGDRDLNGVVFGLRPSERGTVANPLFPHLIRGYCFSIRTIDGRLE